MKTKEQVQQENNIGDVFTTAEFAEYVERGSFNPYDGNGYFHDGEKETTISVWNQQITSKEAMRYPYVCWYNK